MNEIVTYQQMSVFPYCCWLCYQRDNVATAPFYRLGSQRLKPGAKRTNVTVYVCSDCRDGVLEGLDAPRRLTYDKLKAENARLRSAIKDRDSIDEAHAVIVDAARSVLATVDEGAEALVEVDGE